MSKRPWKTNENKFELAALTILKRSKQPLRLKEIVERVVGAGLFAPTGKTPHSSLYVIIRRSNQRAIAQGTEPHFSITRDADGSVLYSANFNKKPK